MFDQTLSKEETMGQYTTGIEKLDKLLTGLSESDLDLFRSEGKWTIRQIIHHIVDAEDIWKTCIKAGLSNSGCYFDISWYVPDNKCAEPLAYATRPVAEALELFKSVRHHIMELIEHLPDTWDRFILLKLTSMPKEKKFTVVGMMGWQVQHLQIHLKQIEETRKVHKI